MSRYLDLATGGNFQNWWHGLKQPWRLGQYCEPGAYNCCTHWIGNVPIGDTLVSEYSLPGRETYNQSTRKYECAGVITKLQPWEPADNVQKLLKPIWKVPGNMQLSETIGEKAANIRGEFASPGWVIRTFMGHTTNSRVPVIFYIVNDHQAPIPETPFFKYEAET